MPRRQGHRTVPTKRCKQLVVSRWVMGGAAETDNMKAACITVAPDSFAVSHVATVIRALAPQIRTPLLARVFIIICSFPARTTITWKTISIRISVALACPLAASGPEHRPCAISIQHCNQHPMYTFDAFWGAQPSAADTQQICAIANPSIWWFWASFLPSHALLSGNGLTYRHFFLLPLKRALNIQVG